jgi:hypothetical protein
VTVRLLLDTDPVSLLSPPRRHEPSRRWSMARLETADEVMTPRGSFTVVSL